MLIYFKPVVRRRVLLFLSFALVVLGARAGVSVQDKGTAAKITPLTRVNTVEQDIGVMVEVFKAKPEDVEECISVFESAGIKATWFLSATFAESHSGLINELMGKRHELGLSGSDDKAMDRLSPAEIRDRLLRSREALLKLGIEPMPFFYAPSGRFSDELVNESFDQGFYPVKGSIDGKVIKGKVDNAVNKVLESVQAGDILIVRIDSKGLIPKGEYIQALAAHLEAQGVSMVSLSDLVRGVR